MDTKIQNNKGDVKNCTRTVVRTRTFPDIGFAVYLDIFQIADAVIQTETHLLVRK